MLVHHHPTNSQVGTKRTCNKINNNEKRVSQTSNGEKRCRKHDGKMAFVFISCINLKSITLLTHIMFCLPQFVHFLSQMLHVGHHLFPKSVSFARCHHACRFWSQPSTRDNVKTKQLIEKIISTLKKTTKIIVGCSSNSE